MTRRPLVYAVCLGALAGAFAAVNLWFAIGLALAGMIVLAVTVFGIERLTEVAWLAAAFLAPMNGLRVTSFAALTDLALLGAAIATVVTAIVVRRPVVVRPPDRVLLGGLMLIVVGGVIGTVFAGNPVQSLLVMSKFVLAAVGSMFAIGLWFAPVEKMRRFCWAWLIGALLSVGWAMSGHSAKIGGRPEGLTTHPNHLGLVCVLGLGLALGLAASADGRERTVAWAAMVLLVGGSLLSGSRAAVLGVLVVVALWAVLSARWTLALRCVGVGVLLAIALGSGVFHLPANSGAGRLLGGASSTASDAARVQLIDDSLHRFAEHPLTGEGFEFAQEAHNIYLQVLVAGGPLALAGLGLVIVSVARPGLRVATALRHGSVDRRFLLPLGMVAGYGGYLAAAVFQNILWDRYLWLFIAAALGLMMAISDAEAAPLSLAGTTEAPNALVRLG